jgi:hypothetical protein
VLDQLGDDLGVRVLLAQPEQAPLDIEIVRPAAPAAELADVRGWVEFAALSGGTIFLYRGALG